MKLSFPSHLHQHMNLLDSEQGRHRLVTFALRLVEGTHLMPEQYERMLLNQFVQGSLTLDQVSEYLESQ